MSDIVVQLVVLAGIAIFLILRLKSVLGTRDGFERPAAPAPQKPAPRKSFDVIEGGVDRDITDNVSEDSPAARNLAKMKVIEPSFSVTEFVSGARGAYEMILMAYENGELADVAPFLDTEVLAAFEDGVEARREAGLIVEAEFIGVRETDLKAAQFDIETGRAELTVKFVGEMTSVVRDAGGDIVEGDPKEVKRQRDIWTFARTMGSEDPNWQLVATGE